MTNSIDFATIRSFYKGATLAKVDAILPAFQKCIEQGYWDPGVSRKVTAAFYSKTIFSKAAREMDANKTVGHDFGYVEVGDLRRVLGSALPIGSIERLEETVANMKAGKLYSYGNQPQVVDESKIPHAYMTIIEKALEMAKILQPMHAAIHTLDSARPAPVFTTMNASPTISAEMKRQQAVAVAVPEMKSEMVEMVGKDGRKVVVPVMTVIWPEGTKHGTSTHRYVDGKCECCGHAIKNPHNWVPLFLTCEDGSKKSLIVGRDCAKTLFGVNMKGDLTLKAVELY